MMVAAVSGWMLIDPKLLAERVNTMLKFQGVRQPMDGPVFTALTEALAQVLNEVLEPLFLPVFKMNSNIEASTWNKMVDDMNKSTSRPVLLDRAEPTLMKEWPTPTGPMTLSVAYRCTNRGCAARAPMSAPSAPTCYTCGKTMEAV